MRPDPAPLPAGRRHRARDRAARRRSAPSHAAQPAAPLAQAPVAPPAAAPPASLDPAKQLPGAIAVSNIDFKRGDGGSGRLILRFSGDGAVPDLRTQGSRVIVNVGNAKLPAALQKPLDVTDFATPVQRIDAARQRRRHQAGAQHQRQLRIDGLPDRHEYVVEIVPRAAGRRSRRARRRPSARPPPAARRSRAYSGRPVTFNFQDVPVRTVLQLIAEESNLNIVAADTVPGNVTLRLINVPWDQALDIVLRAKGLDKRRSGNVVWVAPQAEIAKYEQAKEDARIAIENRAEMVTEYIPINYGNAEDIAKLLTEESKGSWRRRWRRRRQQRSAASCRRAAASASTAAPTRCWSSTSRRRSPRSRDLVSLLDSRSTRC